MSIATAVLERAEVVPVAPRFTARRGVRLGLTVVPWLITVAALVTGLLLTGTPGPDILRYAVYLLATVVLPGTLVHRAVRGSRGNVPEDVGYGSATGLLLQLIVWAFGAATGTHVLLHWWATPVIVAFLAVPALRRHWRIEQPRPLPLRWTWMTAGVMLLLVAWGTWAWSGNPLPPADAVYYPDLMYHLSLVHEMTRPMPFQVPQLAGDELRYHYLSDADMAIGSMVSGVAPATVLLRLWMVPIAAIAVLVLAALTREITGRWWAGPLAAGVAFTGLPLMLGDVVGSYGGAPISFTSPSQTYAMPLTGLLVAITVDALRRVPLTAGSWVMFPLLALACAGAKSSALPPYLAGLVAAVSVAALRHRRVPWAGLGLLVSTGAAVLIGLRLFAGGGAGVLGVQFLALLRWMQPYEDSLGVGQGIEKGGLLPLGVEVATTRGAWFVVWLIVWWLLMQSSRVLGLAALGTAQTRGDPVAWLLGGVTAAGLGATWMFWHPSASQLYFWLCAAPFGVVLTVRLLAEDRRRWRAALCGVVAGAAWAIWAPQTPYPRNNTVAQWSYALAVPLLQAAAVAVCVAVLAVITCHVVLHRRPWRAALAGLVAAVLGASLGTGGSFYVGQVWNAAFGPAPGPPVIERMITAEEMGAALWLSTNSGRDDVIATNVHCVPIRLRPPCDARAFWVAGLAGRRTVVESWAYSDATVAAHGVNGIRYSFQPAPYPSLYALNERVFTDADPADLAELRRRSGVRWLFADSRAGEVTPELALIAAPRYVSGPVTVYLVPATAP